MMSMLLHIAAYLALSAGAGYLLGWFLKDRP